MQFHNLKRNTKNKKAALVGRGGKRGKTSGRGTKGQKARAGRKIRPEIRDTIKKLPKLRGYAFKSIVSKPVTVQIAMLDKKFESGAEITPESLLKSGIISLRSGKLPKVKIVGNTPVSKKFTIIGIKVSSTVKNSIEKALGEVK